MGPGGEWRGGDPEAGPQPLRVQPAAAPSSKRQAPQQHHAQGPLTTLAMSPKHPPAPQQPGSPLACASPHSSSAAPPHGQHLAGIGAPPWSPTKQPRARCGAASVRAPARGPGPGAGPPFPTSVTLSCLGRPSQPLAPHSGPLALVRPPQRSRQDGCGRAPLPGPASSPAASPDKLPPAPVDLPPARPPAPRSST